MTQNFVSPFSNHVLRNITHVLLKQHVAVSFQQQLLLKVVV